MRVPRRCGPESPLLARARLALGGRDQSQFRVKQMDQIGEIFRPVGVAGDALELGGGAHLSFDVSTAFRQ